MIQHVTGILGTKFFVYIKALVHLLGFNLVILRICPTSLINIAPKNIAPL